LDALDRLAPSANEMLALVDAALARSGAPESHPIWPLLRRVGALPGAAVGAVAELRPAPLAAAAPSLRTLAEEYAEASEAAPTVAPGSAGIDVVTAGEDGWVGAAADAFADRWRAMSEHLAGAGESLSARLAATAAYADSLAAWMERTRGGLAEALARVLTSAEAVVVVTGRGGGASSAESPESATTVRACADIGSVVLAPIARAYQEASELSDGWSSRLAELPYRY
jgi:uncharacterized protein YukE